MYWIEVGGNTSYVMKSDQDGDNMVTVRSGLSQPHGLALDEALNRIYWADLKDLIIQYVDIDSSDKIKAS